MLTHVIRMLRTTPAILAHFLACLAPAAAQTGPALPAPSTPTPPDCNILLAPGARGAYQANLWPNGVVPYVWNQTPPPLPFPQGSSITAAQQAKARQAMDEIERVCRVRFVPRTSPLLQPNYLLIQNYTENSSNIGMIGGVQGVQIFNWNLAIPAVNFTIVHELMHALGFWHEHQRYDRDTYVRVNECNIDPAYFPQNYNKMPPPGSGTPPAFPYGPYDFDSVMHYSSCNSFWVSCASSIAACNPCPAPPCTSCALCPTITVLPTWQPPPPNPPIVIGQRSHLSAGDVNTLIYLYGGNPPPNDDCANAQSVTTGTVSIDSRGATNSTPSGCASIGDMWFRWVASCTGTASFALSNISTGYLPALGVYEGSLCPPDPSTIQRACTSSFSSPTTLSCTSGTTYYIRIGRASARGGTATLDISCAVPVCPAGFGWLQAATSGPGPRLDGAMAYDAARQKIVFFGGRDAALVPQNDTWEWDGTAWTLHPTGVAPSPRFSHAMAYDTGSARIILFGGYDNSTFKQDTWEWDGTTWTQFNPPTRPSARAFHAMAAAVSGTSPRVILHGGYGNSPALADTWLYNAATHTWASGPAGPPARFNSAMTYDSARRVSVLFSGDGQTQGDTWEFNGSTWSQRSNSGPPARSLHALSYDSLTGHVILFGGAVSGSSLANDTWEWNGATWLAHGSGGPSPRFGHKMAFDSIAGATVLFGGAGSGSFTDTWKGSWGMPNDDCLSAIPVVVGSNPIDNRCATSSTGLCANLADVWYRFVAPCTGTLSVAVTGATFSPTLAVYSGTSCSALTQLACDQTPPAGASLLSSAGTTYYFRVGGVGGALGVASLQVNCSPSTCPPQFDSLHNFRKLYYIVGDSSGLGWSWCVNWGTDRACELNVPGVFPVGSPASALAAAFVQSILNHSCPNNRLSARQLAAPMGNYFEVTIGNNGLRILDLCVGPAGQPPTCCISPSTFCHFNPDVFEVPLSGADCNANGVDDTIDLIEGTSLDADGNGVPDECDAPPPPPCPCDFNQDERLNSQDFFNFLGAFFRFDPSSDFNHDDRINSQDLFDFIACFFAGC